LDKGTISSRKKNLWRYHELLPVKFEESRVDLGAGFTTLFTIVKD
jgi:threonine synthase